MIRSMTGFGRAEAEGGDVRVTWELRSVNGKGLDVRLRVPGRMDALEPKLRAVAKDALGRGNVQAGLTIDREADGARLQIDHAALDLTVATAREAAERHGLAMPDLGTFLAMRGVMEVVEAEDDAEAVSALVLATFGDAVAALAADRAREGAALFAVLSGQVDRIAELTAAAEADPSRGADAVRARLASQVEALSGSKGLDAERLHAEAAMLAVRADLAEEIDRLNAHVAAARNLLASDVPAGRRLDFLAQEFGREANTLCAKSNAVSLTAIGLELKVVVDQFREQIANVE